MDDPERFNSSRKTPVRSLHPRRGCTSAPPGGRLAEYVKHFATVEIDSTFYGTPRRSTVERWRRIVPEGFSSLPSSFGVAEGKPSLILTPVTRMLLWAPSNSLLGQVNFGIREHF
jgi:Protein of unknown function DUF72